MLRNYNFLLKSIFLWIVSKNKLDNNADVYIPSAGTHISPPVFAAVYFLIRPRSKNVAQISDSSDSTDAQRQKSKNYSRSLGICTFVDQSSIPACMSGILSGDAYAGSNSHEYFTPLRQNQNICRIK